MFPRSLAPTSDRREPRRRAYQERQARMATIQIERRHPPISIRAAEVQINVAA
jgi:hypothetical protein